MKQNFEVGHDVAIILTLLATQRNISLDETLTRMIRLFMEDEKKIYDKELDRDQPTQLDQNDFLKFIPKMEIDHV